MAYEAPSKYEGTGNYGDLIESEQAYWDEYTNLRQISDWPGFDAAQGQRKTDSRAWITGRMDYIVALASGEVEGETSGWAHADRGERYDFLYRLNSGAPKHEVRLPCPATATDAEKVYIEEREVYLAFGSVDAAQKARKQANVDWLVAQRQKLYRLGERDGWPEAGRRGRYAALCIATHHGKAYEKWDETHNKWGEPTGGGSANGDTPSQRDAALAWCKRYLGTSERPSGSNKGHPQPSNWQKRVYGSDGVPWCACFAVCSAWDVGVKGSGSAGCALNTELARRGVGIYRGFTTDPARVRRGDHFFIGANHTGVVREDHITNSRVPTYEGNTSPGNEGSQFNGGTVASKVRSTRAVGGSITGFGLVRFID
jgi:hypothetical protein